jgi:cytochrome P450
MSPITCGVSVGTDCRLDEEEPMDTMSPGAEAALPEVLLFAQTTADDPLPAYRQLREQCPVARSSFGDNFSVTISRYEDVVWAMRHPEVFSSADAVHVGNERPMIPLQVDPPEHAGYRRLLDPEFAPKKMAELEDDARILVNRIIDTFADQGRCDFHEDFATPLPSTIFLRLMGMAQDDLPIFLRWRDNIIRPDVELGDFEGAARIRQETGQEMYSYFGEAMDARLTSPDTGLLSRLLSAEIEGHRLSREELLDICYLLILGGLDTVTATLDCAIRHLATHPELRQRLIDDPSTSAAVVEEMLRIETPVMVILRTVKEDIEFGGVALQGGDGVVLVLGAANSDDGEFKDPEGADFDRERNRHLAFGGGPHRCLGSHLARLELRVALEEFHRRIPNYRIEEGAKIHFSPGIRQANHLPLVWEPRS